MIRFSSVVVPALAIITVAATLQATTNPAYATERCAKKDEMGNCIVRTGEDGDPAPTPPDRDEPEDGATRIVERWLDYCSDEAGQPATCYLRPPCEEDGYEHRTIEQREMVYRDDRWKPNELLTGNWYLANPSTQCRDVEGEVTEGEVREAAAEFGMESGTIETAPPGQRTLVDVETIVWTAQGSYDFTLPVGDTEIALTATPEQYRWDFGDGENAEHDTPGVEYADGLPMDEYHTHTYESTGEFEIELTIDYLVFYQTGDGEWRTISETIPSEPHGHTVTVVQKHNRLNNGR